MSWTNLAIIVVLFGILYRFVIPWLFPDVVSGTRKLKVDGEEQEFQMHHNMNLFNSAGSSQGRSQLRARKKANSDTTV